MFAHERPAPASDLCDWIGPLSPAFVALHAASSGSDGPPPAQPMAGAASEGRTAPAGPEPQSSPESSPGVVADPRIDELCVLFHTLNNQLGVVITYAELLEAKAPDEGLRARATQVLTAALEALGTSKQISRTVIR